MYDVINQELSAIILVYVAFSGASLLTYPIVRLVASAIERGAERWR